MFRETHLKLLSPILYKMYKNIHTYVASRTPFPSNICNFANFTNSNKSFYIDMSESVYFEKT